MGAPGFVVELGESPVAAILREHPIERPGPGAGVNPIACAAADPGIEGGQKHRFGAATAAS